MEKSISSLLRDKANDACGQSSLGHDMIGGNGAERWGESPRTRRTPREWALSSLAAARSTEAWKSSRD